MEATAVGLGHLLTSYIKYGRRKMTFLVKLTASGLGYLLWHSFYIRERTEDFMDLLLNLNHSDGIWIDGSHRVFEGTQFEGLRFRVKIKSLTRTEMRGIRKQAKTGKRGEVEEDILFPEIFKKCCLDWELKDDQGQPIPYSEENKKRLLEQVPSFTNLIAVACHEAQIKVAEQAEEEVKNL